MLYKHNCTHTEMHVSLTHYVKVYSNRKRPSSRCLLLIKEELVNIDIISLYNMSFLNLTFVYKKNVSRIFIFTIAKIDNYMNILYKLKKKNRWLITGKPMTDMRGFTACFVEIAFRVSHFFNNIQWMLNLCKHGVFSLDINLKYIYLCNIW